MDTRNLIYVFFAEEKAYDSQQRPVVSAGWTDMANLEKDTVTIIRDDQHGGTVATSADRVSVRVSGINKPAPEHVIR